MRLITLISRLSFGPASLDLDYPALAENQYQAILIHHLFHHPTFQVINDSFQDPCLPYPLAFTVHHTDSNIGFDQEVAFCLHEAFAALTSRSIVQIH